MKLMKVRQFAVAGLGALLMSSALLTGCSGAATSAGSAAGSAAVTEAAGSSDSGATRTVKDTDGNEVTIPAKVTKVAPTIGAFAQVTEMLTNGNGKIVAAATKQVDDNFKSVFSDFTKSNPDNNDSTSPAAPRWPTAPSPRSPTSSSSSSRMPA